MNSMEKTIETEAKKEVQPLVKLLAMIGERQYLIAGMTAEISDLMQQVHEQYPTKQAQAK